MPARPTNEPTNYFAFAKQSAKDSEGSTFHFIKHLDGTGYDIEEDVTSEREGGDGQEVGLRYKTKIKTNPQFVVNGRPQILGRAFAGVLGQDTAASHAVGADHTAQPVASLPYFTVDQRSADSVERVSNVQFTSLTEEFEAGKPLKVTVGAVSGGSAYSRAEASALTPARESAAPLLYPGASVVLDIAGATSPKVTKGKIEIKRAVDDDIQTTGLNTEDVVPLNFDVDLDLTVKYEDKALYDKVHYGGGTMVPLDLATGNFDLFSSKGSFQHRVAMPLLQFTGAKVNRLDPDGKTVYLDLAAMTVKHASHAIFAVTRTTDAAAY